MVSELRVSKSDICMYLWIWGYCYVLWFCFGVNSDATLIGMYGIGCSDGGVLQHARCPVF